jgi:hypothetical protein
MGASSAACSANSRELAMTIFVSMMSPTLTPMMASRFLRARRSRHGRFYQWSERALMRCCTAMSAPDLAALEIHHADDLRDARIVGLSVRRHPEGFSRSRTTA